MNYVEKSLSKYERYNWGMEHIYWCKQHDAINDLCPKSEVIGWIEDEEVLEHKGIQKKQGSSLKG